MNKIIKPYKSYCKLQLLNTNNITGWVGWNRYKTKESASQAIIDLYKWWNVVEVKWVYDPYGNIKP